MEDGEDEHKEIDIEDQENPQETLANEAASSHVEGNVDQATFSEVFSFESLRLHSSTTVSPESENNFLKGCKW